MNQSLTQTAKILTLAVILSVGASYVYAWTAPTATPPGGNVSAPVNVGSASQLKTGGFDIANTLSANKGIFTGNVGIGVLNPATKLEIGETSGGTATYNSDIIDAYPDPTPKCSCDTSSDWDCNSSSFTGTDVGPVCYDTAADYGVSWRYNRTGTGSFLLKTNGNIGADKYCDRSGGNCITNTGGGIKFADGTTQTTAPVADIWTKVAVGIYYNGGSVGIGYSNPSEKLEVNGNVKAAGFYYSSSDERLKKDIITLSGSLEKILNLRGVQFKWKNGDDSENIGFIAQEVEKVVPQVVKDGSDGMKSLQYGNIVPLLVEAMKEQQKQIDSLKTEIEVLRGNR